MLSLLQAFFAFLSISHSSFSLLFHSFSLPQEPLALTVQAYLHHSLVASLPRYLMYIMPWSSNTHFPLLNQRYILSVFVKNMFREELLLLHRSFSSSHFFTNYFPLSPSFFLPTLSHVSERERGREGERMSVFCLHLSRNIMSDDHRSLLLPFSSFIRRPMMINPRREGQGKKNHTDQRKGEKR